MKDHLSVHERLVREEKPAASTERAFGIVFAVVFGIVAVWPLLHGGPIRYWAVATAVLLVIVAFAIPKILKPFNLLWLAFGALLHRIMSPIVLGGMFYLIFTPVALLFRLLGKDPLRLKLERSAQSYWIDRDPPGPDPATMNHQF
jgi:hypothetical protein